MADYKEYPISNDEYSIFKRRKEEIRNVKEGIRGMVHSEQYPLPLVLTNGHGWLKKRISNIE